MTAPDPDAGRIKDPDEAAVAAMAEYHRRVIVAMASVLGDKWRGTGIACCGENHIRDTRTALWAPGCAHFRSTR